MTADRIPSDPRDLAAIRHERDQYLQQIHELIGQLPEEDSLASSIAELPPAAQQALVRQFSANLQQSFMLSPEFTLRKKQLYPLGEWDIWVILCGRGWGKNYAACGFFKERIARGDKRIHIVTKHIADYRDTVILGASGILASYQYQDPPRWEPSKRTLTWANGAQAICFSAEDPDQLRGPQCESWYADEVASWRYLQATWDQLMFGWRLGADPRGMITTTPRPLKFLRDLIAKPRNYVTRGHTLENRKNLSALALQNYLESYEGTRLGAQELAGEILNNSEGALWSGQQLDSLRIDAREPAAVMTRPRVVSVDPCMKGDGAECGIVTGGLFGKQIVVLRDDSIKAPPSVWTKRVVEVAKETGASHIIAEGNQGGEMVRDAIKAWNPNAHVELMYSREGKRARAEPVSVVYEAGRVRHAGHFVALEDQMCNWVPQESSYSPDRLDALVQLVGFLDRRMVSGAFTPPDPGVTRKNSEWRKFGLEVGPGSPFKKPPRPPWQR